jgi:hypothetical protein
MLGELDKKDDTHGGPLQMINTGSDSVLGTSRRQCCGINRRGDGEKPQRSRCRSE